MKIALGSAQFGLAYGIANTSGQVSADKVSEILKMASSNNIDTLDTAISYGNSHEVLGQAGVKNFKIVTKLPAIPINIQNVAAWTEKSIKDSLEKLNKESIYGLLLHDHESLIKDNSLEVLTALKDMKNSGLIQKIGVSIYNPQELEKLIDFMEVDLVQAPLNLIDQRLIKTGWLRRLKSMGVEIHTRSSFLQGLLLMEPYKIPKSFEKWSGLLRKWHKELLARKLDPISECLNFVLSITDIDRVVVGVETKDQLQDIIKIVKEKNISNGWEFMQSEDEDLINPSKWLKE